MEQIRRLTFTAGSTCWSVVSDYTYADLRATCLHDVIRVLGIAPEDGVKRYEIVFSQDGIKIKAYTSILYDVWMEFSLYPLK